MKMLFFLKKNNSKKKPSYYTLNKKKCLNLCLLEFVSEIISYDDL